MALFFGMETNKLCQFMDKKTPFCERYPDKARPRKI